MSNTRTKSKATKYETIEGLKSFETVDSNVSKKYVPIYSSEIVELLDPEFTFIDAVKFRPGSSAHYVDLESENGDYLRIYNSYDRELAVRVNLVSDGMIIPLGIDRLVHIGQKAQTFTEDFTNAKQDILDAIDTAKAVDTYLKNTEITPDFAKTVTESLFTLPKARKSVGIINPVDALIPTKVSIKEYLKKSITNYLQGEYQYLLADGKSIKGPKQGTMVARIEAENRVLKTLREENPELFL